MPDWFLPLLSGLGNASGWVVLVAVLLLIGFGFLRGDLVPGWVHKAEVKRGDQLEERLNAKSAKDEAAAAAASIAEQAALKVIGLQRAGRGVADESHEPF